MFLIRKRFKQLLRFICYALIFSVILTVVLSLCSHSTKYVSSNQKITVSNSDWNFYETFEDEQTTNSSIKNNATPNCDTIHLAMVCGGHNFTKDLYVLLKSILFYRTNPIKLHLMVDDKSKKTLTVLFDSWQVPALYFEYYNASEYEHSISWIPTHHYSNQFGLLKLIFPKAIHEKTNVTKVIMLDLDMLMLGNVNEIWNKLELMQMNGAAIGLVENQSDWYLGNQKETGPIIQDRLIWPAIKRGFNTGLVLLNLKKLKDENWDQIWRQIAELELVTRFSTALADQDVFNAVSKSHPQLFYTLPCSFNLQLSDHPKLNETCRESLDRSSNRFELIHWNSPHKLKTTNVFAENYRKWYSTFLNWDSNLLKRDVCSLVQIAQDTNSTSNSSWAKVGHQEENCNEIRPRPGDKLRTYLYYFEMEPSKRKGPDVTCVVHLSIDRLHAFDDLAAHWSGPISAAIYLSEFETSLFVESLKESANLKNRNNIGYHLVFRDHGFNYPINSLRNIALNQADTPYVFLIDADFLPSNNLYEYLIHTVESMSDQKSLEKQALVVPAFENSQYKFEFPSSKSEFVRQLNLGSISMFRAQIWPQGHAATNFARWKVSTRPYNVDWQPDYEPFIVTSKNVARFDERFVGFGWNKVEHIMQLAASNYEFIVLPDAFVIHQFHPASYDIMRHRESSKYRACIRQLKRNFSLELLKMYPDFVNKLKPASQVGITSGVSHVIQN